jgi:hypothetical protein
MLGLISQTYAEVVVGDLKEGDLVVINPDTN